ncbi:MAG: heavy metal-associated domain-containing protein, partial [Bacteroidales bacterium]|nr:heavy metal-associated domain-containing protein [Bacteroidales bacterium]
IKGMTCNHCRQSAEKAILNVKGVSSATVSLDKGEAYVEGTASQEDICKVIEEIGFTCSVK